MAHELLLFFHSSCHRIGNGNPPSDTNNSSTFLQMFFYTPPTLGLLALMHSISGFYYLMPRKSVYDRISNEIQSFRLKC